MSRIRYPHLTRLAGGDPLKRWPNVPGLDHGIAEEKLAEGVPDERVLAFLERLERMGTDAWVCPFVWIDGKGSSAS